MKRGYILQVGLFSWALVHCGPMDEQDADYTDDSIINGEVIDENEFPSVGRLFHGCTGTLIGTRTVLTAAHCTWDTTDGRVLRDGITFGGRDYRADRMVAHPDFIDWDVDPRQSTMHDISLLMYDFAVPRAKSTFLTRSPIAGEPITLVGYGEEVNTLAKRMGTNEIDSLFNSEHNFGYTTRSGGNGILEGGDSGGPTFVRSYDLDIQAGVHRGSNRSSYSDDVNVAFVDSWILQRSGFNAMPSPPFGNRVWVQIKKPGTNQCLYSDELGSGRKAKLGRCGGSGDAKYRWDIVLAKSGPQAGLFVLRNRFNRHKCLKRVGNVFEMHPCFHRAAEMPMSIFQKGNGRYMFISRNSDRCVDGLGGREEVRVQECSLISARLEWEITR